MAVLFALLTLISACKKEKIEPTDYDMAILDAINAHRTSIGLIPLMHNDYLWELARGHSKNMADSKTLANHDGIDDRYDKITRTFGSGSVAENVALESGNVKAAELINLWLGSISLKENIEGNFNITGISAVLSEDGTWYYTQIFYNQ